VDSVDVNQPITLPSLTRFIPDRAALDDPTRAASGAAVLAAPAAGRLGPAPFLRLTLPDPFENAWD
jgi:hypothetical protein